MRLEQEAFTSAYGALGPAKVVLPLPPLLVEPASAAMPATPDPGMIPAARPGDTPPQVGSFWSALCSAQAWLVPPSCGVQIDLTSSVRHMLIQRTMVSSKFLRSTVSSACWQRRGHLLMIGPLAYGQASAKRNPLGKDSSTSDYGRKAYGNDALPGAGATHRRAESRAYDRYGDYAAREQVAAW